MISYGKDCILLKFVLYICSDLYHKTLLSIVLETHDVEPWNLLLPVPKLLTLNFPNVREGVMVRK